MFLINSNIFLELILGQARADECEAFLAEVEEGSREAVITDLTLDSILIAMEHRGRDASDLAKFILSISSYRGLKMYWLSLVDRFHAVAHMDRLGLDFEDSTVLETCLRLKAEGIVSFDRDFDGVEGVRRIEPRDLPHRR